MRPVGGWGCQILEKELGERAPTWNQISQREPHFALSPQSQSPIAGWEGARHRNWTVSAGVASQPHPQPCLQLSPGPACFDAEVAAAVAALPLSFSRMEVVCVEEESSGCPPTKGGHCPVPQGLLTSPLKHIVSTENLCP